MSWNDRATRKLRTHAYALMRELERMHRAPDLVPPTMGSLALDRMQRLLDLLVDNVEPTLTPVREFIDQQLGGA